MNLPQIGEHTIECLPDRRWDLIRMPLAQLGKSASRLGPHRDDHAEFGQQPAQPVDQSRVVAHQAGATLVNHQYGLLLGRLDRHEAHARPARRLADRFGIIAVVLTRSALNPAQRRRTGDR